MAPNSSVRIARIVGQPSATVWSQVFSLTNVPLSSQQTLRGKSLCFGLLSVNTDKEDGAAEIGSQIVGLIQQLWQEKTDSSADKQVSILKRLEHQKAATLGLDVLLLCIDQDQLIVGGIGQVKVLLQRHQAPKEIFSPTGVIKVIQGDWQVADQLLIGTQSLISNMSPSLIKQSLGFTNANQLEEELAVIIRSDQQSEWVAGLVLNIFTSDPDELTTSETASKPTSFTQITNRLKRVFASKSAPVYLKSQKKPRKIAFSVGLVVLAMLCISMVLGYQQRRRQLLQHRYDEAYSQAKQYVDAAQLVMTQNPLEAKRLLAQAKSSLEQSMPSLSDQPEYEVQLKAYYQTVLDQYLQASGQNLLDNLSPWYDTTLIRENFIGTKLVRSADYLYILSPSLGLLAQVDLASKQGKLVGGGQELQGAKLFDVLNDQAVLITNSGLVEVSTIRKTSSIIRPPDSSLSDPTALSLFGTNVYILDSSGNQIWKYARASSQLGEAMPWFNEGTNYQIGSVSDMAIDGNIWLADTSGKIWKLEQGGRREFAISNLEPALSSPKYLDTNEAVDFLLILEPSKQRLLKISKSGEYQQQYVWSELAAAADVALSQDGSSGYVLINNQIFKINL